MVIQVYYSTTQEAEGGGMWVQGQPGLHSLKKKRKKKNSYLLKKDA
jgi:hypothetical protein